MLRQSRVLREVLGLVIVTNVRLGVKGYMGLTIAGTNNTNGFRVSRRAWRCQVK